MALAEKMTSPLVYLREQTRWRPIEIVFWLATLLPYVLFPNYLSLASQIAITALFALSLDLILGYAGIVSLGHAAYFGVGAYTAGLVSKHGWGEPLTGLAMAGLAAGIVGYASRLHHLPVSASGTHHADDRLRAVAGRSSPTARLADRRHGRSARHPYLEAAGRVSASICSATPHTATRLARCLWCFCSRGGSFIRHSACRCAAFAKIMSRMPAIGAPSRAHLRTIYTIAACIAGIAGAIVDADHRNRVAGFARLSSAPPRWWSMLVLGGAGRLYGGLVGAIIFMVARDQFSGIEPQYWYFWIGILLVGVVMLLPNGILGGLAKLSLALEPIVSSTGAGDARPRQELRLAGGRKRYRNRIAARRALRADRPERRRQDHADQSHHRNAPAGRRPASCSTMPISRRSRPISGCGGAWFAPIRSTRCFRI